MNKVIQVPLAVVLAKLTNTKEENWVFDESNSVLKGNQRRYFFDSINHNEDSVVIVTEAGSMKVDSMKQGILFNDHITKFEEMYPETITETNPDV